MHIENNQLLMYIPTSELQHWATRGEWKAMEKFITERWNESYYITDLFYADDVYYALMEKEIGWNKQRYRWSKNFIDDDIKQGWNDKLWITSLFFDGSFWCVVMSDVSKIQQQRYYKSVQFPKAQIQKDWSDGFVITHLAYGQGIWVLVMSNNVDYKNEQEWFTRFRFRSSFLEEKLTKSNKIITSIVYGDGKWAFALAKHPKVSAQRILYTKHFPEDEIKNFWDEGFNISKAFHNGKKWLFTFSAYISEEDKVKAPMQHAIKMRMYFEQEEYKKVIQYFDDNLSKTEDLEIIDFYIQSLYKSGRLDIAKEKIELYSKKLKTNQWNEILAHYHYSKKEYDWALFYYKNSNNEKLKEVEEIYLNFETLFAKKQYSEAIKYFEKNLKWSISRKANLIVPLYLEAYYKSEQYKKGVKEFLHFANVIENDQSFYEIGADLCVKLSEQINDQELKKKALFYYRAISPRNIVLKNKIDAILTILKKDDSDNWKKQLEKQEQERRNKELENKNKYI